MSQLRSWSTEGMSPQKRLQYWNDCAVEALATPMSVDAADARDFWGKISHVSLSSLHMTEVSSGAATVHHSTTHAARSVTGAFQLLVQLSGQSIYVQDGREAHLSPGDFTLVDCNRPYQLTFTEPVANLVVAIHHDQLKPYLGCPESFAAMKLSGCTGPSALASRFFRSLWHQPEDFVAGCTSPFLERAVLDMVATAYSALAPRSSTATSHVITRRVRVMRYIEQHLDNPDLGAKMIAVAFRVTTRCIYRLFSGESETLANYIQRRRIEETARALANPLQKNRSISSIAYDNGFSSIAHFSKVFREFHGRSPREYREVAQSTGTIPPCA